MADAIDTQNAGIHFYTKNLIEALLEIDKKNRYSFIHSREHSFFQNKEHYILPKLSGLGSETIRRSLRIPRLIRKINPDVVIEPCHIGPFNIPRRIKRVVTIHDITPIIFPHFHTTRGHLVHKLLLKRSLSNADLILTPSETTKKDILSRYKVKRDPEVTPLGIEAPKSNKATPLDSPYILYLGTLEPRKNLQILVKAFKNLQLPHHKLVLAGPIGWKSEELLAEIANNPKIIQTNYLTPEQKAAHLQNADIFIYPSIYEGFGLPPMEALSYGTPIITSTGGSLGELFSEHALTFNPEDQSTLEKHITTLLTSPSLRTKLSKKGQEYSKEFRWINTAARTLKAIQSL